MTGFDVKSAAISTLLALIVVCFITLFNGCAAIKYGTNSEYVRSLDNPVYVGTQVNGTKLIRDDGVIFAGIDFIPSAIIDTGLLPWYSGLYWWHDKTIIGEKNNEQTP